MPNKLNKIILEPSLNNRLPYKQLPVNTLRRVNHGQLETGEKTS